SNVMSSGALGVEILISGKVPSARAKTWRFYQGYLKKCGDIAVSEVRVAYTVANLKSGTIGIKVSIMTPDTELPDKIIILKEQKELVEEFEEVRDEAVKKEMQEKVTELNSLEKEIKTEDTKAQGLAAKKEEEEQEEKKPEKTFRKKASSKSEKQNQQKKVNEKGAKKYKK
nr:hypothetical protein [Nanoarchaeota archaeon]